MRGDRSGLYSFDIFKIVAQILAENIIKLHNMKTATSMKLANPKPKKNPYQTNIQIINNLKHTLSKPTNVQAQRTLKIMQKLIENISVFLYLDSDFVIKFNEIGNPQKSKLNKALVQELSPETLELFIREAKLESEFRPLNNSIEQQIKDGEEVEAERMADYNRIKKDMQMNFKTLVRQLAQEKNDFEIVKSLKGTSALNAEVLQINQSLSNYKIIMQKKLATAAEEQDMHTKLLEELSAKIQSLQKSKANCQQELQRLRQERSRHAEEKKQEIDKLKSQIRDVKTNKQKQLEKIKKESKQMAEALEKAHKAEEEKLQSSINQEKAKFVKLKEENTKDEGALKTKKASTEGTLQDNIATYDRQMQAQHKVKSDLQRQLKRLTDELNNFKKHFQQIQIERKREEELIAAHKKRQQLYELMERRKDQAATRIKRAYKMFKNKSKKKGKKKPKKK